MIFLVCVCVYVWNVTEKWKSKAFEKWSLPLSLVESFHWLVGSQTHVLFLKHFQKNWTQNWWWFQKPYQQNGHWLLFIVILNRTLSNCLAFCSLTDFFSKYCSVLFVIIRVENFIQKSQCYSVCLIYETGGRRIDLEGYSLTVSRKQDVSKLEKRTNALIPTSVHATSPARGSNLTLLQKHTLLSMSPVSVTTPAIITTTTTTTPSIASNSKISPSDSSTTLISSRTRTQHTVSGHSTSITTTATTTSEISQNNEEEEQSLTGLKSYPAIFCAPQVPKSCLIVWLFESFNSFCSFICFFCCIRKILL